MWRVGVEKLTSEGFWLSSVRTLSQPALCLPVVLVGETSVSQGECHSGRAIKGKSKGTRGLIVLLLKVAIDFSYLKATLQGVPF